MRNSDFWLDALERAVRTFAQALLGALTAGLIVTDAAQWRAALIASAVAAFASLLTSVVASGVGEKGTPSLLPEESK
jgi:hypothetical protein